jgi:hypothetical protein
VVRARTLMLAVAACAVAVPAEAGAAALHVRPAQVAPGAHTRVFGSAAGGCSAGDAVTLISRAFGGTHRFAGVPAVSTPVRAGGAFSRRVRIPARRAPGSYTVTARCGGGDLGVVRHLRVLAPGLTARRVRIGDHPAFVRAVVHFRGGTLGATDAEAADPDPFDGAARVSVAHAGIAATAATAHRFGLRVRVQQASGRLRVRLAGAARRFKYLAHRTLHGPERLVIDLYKSRPPGAAAQIPSAPGGCLAIARHAATDGTIAASGTARGIFERQFTLAVRDARGRVAGHTTVAFGTSPAWSATVSYSVPADQPGTLEAVDLSARDGALACLAQIRVPLAAAISAVGARRGPPGPRRP